MVSPDAPQSATSGLKTWMVSPGLVVIVAGNNTLVFPVEKLPLVDIVCVNPTLANPLWALKLEILWITALFAEKSVKPADVMIYARGDWFSLYQLLAGNEVSGRK